MKKITIIATDEDNKLNKILKEIASRGNGGHSYSIIIEDKAFFWDGDGSDRINSIQCEEFFTKYDLRDMIRREIRSKERIVCAPKESIAITNSDYKSLPEIVLKKKKEKETEKMSQ